jgi:LPXTG-site transpeptidase (sortase) family protein
VVTTRSIAAVAVVGAAVAFGAAACVSARDGQGAAGRGVPAAISSAASLPDAGRPPATAQPRPRDPTPRPTRSAQQPTSASQPRPGQATTHEPATSRAFTLVVAMGSGAITVNVGSISVASHEPVDPPHDTAEQWNTAAWVEQSTSPSTPGEGTTYVYGHACHHHVCSFTNLKDADVGDQVRVTTAVRASTYTIERIGLSSKSANSLPSWAADSTVPNRIVLVTCAYEQGDTSTDNIVVVARLNR